MDVGIAQARILIVDDQEDNVQVVRRILESEGYSDIRSTNDPREVVDLTLGFDPDLILLDIIMPEMDGYQVWDLLKADDRTREIPIIMLTAQAILTHTPKDFLYGLYGYVAKPFSRDELIAVIGPRRGGAPTSPPSSAASRSR